VSWVRAHTSLDDVARSLIVLSGIVAIFGAGLVIGPGFNNPLRFGPWIVLFAMIAFFVPGLLGLVAGLYLKRRAAWSAPLGLASCVLQMLVAIVGVIGQFFLTPISVVPLLACAAWAIAAAFLAVELTRYRHALRSDAASSRGFEIEPR
jgi:hypothetical protein